MSRRRRLLVLAAFAVLPWASPPRARAAEPAPRGSLRVAVPAREGPHSHITPLVYWGGFQTKTAIYEPLVRFGAGGRLEPALLRSWDVSPDGRVYTLRLREGVLCHDGKPLDAEQVRDHLVRWRGNPGNRWIGSTDRMERVEATGPLEVRVTLSEPWCFLEECAIVNPGHVVGVGAYDHEGTFVKPVGTGPYVVATAAADESYACVAHDAWWGGRPGLERLEFVRLASADVETPRTIALVRDGVVDVVADGEGPILPREALRDAAADPRLEVWRGPGSSVTFLSMNTGRAPFSDREARRRVAAAIDRVALVREGELGYAEPSTTLFRAGWAGWPKGGTAAAPTSPAPVDAARAVLLVRGTSERMKRHAALLRVQLRAAGVEVEVRTPATWAELREQLARGEYDLLLRSTHGTPYDPFVMLQTLFVRKPEGRTASSAPPLWEDEALRRALTAALGAVGAEARAQGFAAVQRRLDEEVPVVPLFISDRIAVSAAHVGGLSIGENGYDLGLGRATSGVLRPAVAPAAAPVTTAVAAPAPPPAPTDPRDGEVPLPAENGWNAFLVLDNGKVGIWTVKSFQAFERLGSPEIVAIDDAGRLFVLTSYSGRWTPYSAIQDGGWLGTFDVADLDADLPGREIYVGGKSGNVYEVVPHASGVLDARLAATLPGQAVNVVLAADVVPARPGPELLAFTWPDGMYVLGHAGRASRLEVLHADPTPERVRDALILPGAEGAPPEVVTVSRNGHLMAVTFPGGKPSWRVLHEEAMGMGRVSLRPARPGTPPVLYSCLDDGRVLRHERAGDGAWRTETIYLGPQGTRGVVAGRFHADPAVESVAAFGYSTRVEILARVDGRWTVETIFRDRDKGHWLARAELDGRNATDELVASGFGGRIVLLARPPGYGRAELSDPEATR